ncbi:MAG: SDR family oxidoreductase [Planctomycetales bacterium]|nr:SDR family oxidoreductase [bacterium]UNM09529.1 MAG: SDR family oxidoreductase [Planctomycetales bacterium]
MLIDLSGQVAIVTGASRGVGRATAIRLSQLGASVALLGRNQAALERTAELCREHAEIAGCWSPELSDTEELAAAVHDISESCGRIDILVNNAGVFYPARLDSADPFDIDRMLDVNLKGLLHATRICLPYLKESCMARGRAVVVNISSNAGRFGIPGEAAYCASKHGVMGFSEGLFQEERELGLKVCTICPGWIATEMVEESGIDMDRAIKPSEVAEMVATVVRWPDNSCPTEIRLYPQRSPV